MRQGVRSDWSSVPAHVRAGVDDLLGTRVVSATNLSGGFSPGPAARCELADGRRVFAKAAGAVLKPVSPELHRTEAAVLAALPPDHPAPRLIGTIDDGDWIALVVEWVEGDPPTTPLSASDCRRMLALVGHLADIGHGRRPAGILPIAERHPSLTGHWELLAGAGAGIIDQLDSWSRAHLDRL